MPYTIEAASLNERVTQSIDGTPVYMSSSFKLSEKLTLNSLHNVF